MQSIRSRIAAVAVSSRSVRQPGLVQTHLLTRTLSTQKQTAVELLVADHRHFRDLYDRIKRATDSTEKQRLANEIIGSIAPHSAAEEIVLYPTIRNTAKDPQAADKSLQEHQALKETLEKLRLTNPSKPDFMPLIEQSEKLLFDHVAYEESEVLPELKSVLKHEDLTEMATLIETVKKAAPTQPHPEAPLTPPGNLIMGPISGFIDRVKEYALGGRKSTKQQEVS